MKSSGTISIPNVGSEKSECINLTYSIKDVGKLTDCKKLVDEIDDQHDYESNVALTVSDFGTQDEQWNISYKIKACDDEKDARKLKTELDKFLKKKGGQTTLDETV